MITLTVRAVRPRRQPTFYFSVEIIQWSETLLSTPYIYLSLITAKLLLYGSTALTDEQNTLIFTKVQKYILDSKRFVNAKYTETAFHPSSSFYFIFMYILFSSTFAIFIVNCLLFCNVRSIFHERIRDSTYVMMFSHCCRFVRRRIYISSACFRILVVYYILYWISMSYYWITNYV